MRLPDFASHKGESSEDDKCSEDGLSKNCWRIFTFSNELIVLVYNLFERKAMMDELEFQFLLDKLKLIVGS